MLSLGAGSACDVCLEPFGHESKAPCSIQCGHVFCVDCLNHITRPNCPLCRTTFDQRTVTKLHVDVDGVRSPPSPSIKATCPTAAEQEARRLQEAIASIANEGTTEPRLRQLIAECRTFLSSQPRNLFSDLRVSHRMIAYLCEVKSTLKSQNQAVDSLKEQILQLDAEKAEFKQRVDDMIIMNRDERETALAVEMSLREHCSRAHAAYGTMVDFQYNFVITEWVRLNEEVRCLRPAIGPHMTGIEARTADMHPASPDSSTGFAQGGFLSSFDPMSFKGAAITEEDSFLISPLPEFTGRLPSALDSFAALPEVDDDIEKKTKAAPVYETDKPSFAHLSEGKSMIGKEPAVSRRPTFIDYASQADVSPEPSAPAAAPTASGLTLSMPKTHDLQLPRSRSSSRGRSLRSRASSRSPVQTASSLGKPSPTKPSPDVQTSSQLNLPQSRDGEVLRSRLYDLLDTAVSSSLPNMPAPFPSTLTRDGPTSRDTQASRPPSRSSTSSSQGQSSVSTSDRPERPQGIPISSRDSAVAPSASPSASISPKYYLAQLQAHVPVSHASSAAKVLEESQRAMKAQQKEAERARRRAEREQREAANESERSRIQTPPVHAHPSPLNLREHTAATYVSHIYSHANSLSRRGSTATQGRPTPSIRREESLSSPRRPMGNSKNTVATGLILNPNVVSDTMLRT